MLRVLIFLYIVIFYQFSFQSNATAHEQPSELRYLGNEGVMVTDGKNKIIFDPFFHNVFDTYTLVPEEIREAIFSGKPPYDNISAVFISHAHADHFDAGDIFKFLKFNSKVRLIAPQQAVDQLLVSSKSDSIRKQVSAIKLGFGDAPVSFELGKIKVEAVRIPHSGWPSRKEVENIVYRITLNEKVTVMHMGDADANDQHFSPYKKFWEQQVTDTAFPPYWFMLSDTGNAILDTRINTKTSIGIHVNSKVPESLKATGKDYFSKPGEVRRFSVKNAH